MGYVVHNRSKGLPFPTQLSPQLKYLFVEKLQFLFRERSCFFIFKELFPKQFSEPHVSFDVVENQVDVFRPSYYDTV